MKQYTVAILGATGAVGTQMLECLNEQEFPVGKLKLLASARSAGKTVEFRGEQIVIEEACPEAFEGCDIVLGAAGDDIAKELLPEAVKRGAVVVDNSHAFRHGSRGAAGRARDQCRRYQMASRPYRQPQLRDHHRPGSHLAAASARRREAHDRLDVPGGFGCWRSRYGRARGYSWPPWAVARRFPSRARLPPSWRAT